MALNTTSTQLETLIHFSDYQNEKISSIQVGLENNMSLIVKKDENNKGVTFTLKDNITDSVEVSATIEKSKLQSLIKILNIMYRQTISNTSQTNNVEN